MAFGHLLLIKPTPNGIILETHRRTQIKNEIAPVPDQRQISIYNGLLAKNTINWTERKPASGIYNCVGHVWASRRTSVYDDLETVLQTIYRDDGYRVVNWPRESLAPGDLATYWDSATKRTSFYHVGIVVEIKSSGGMSAPFVLSKWNDYCGEVVHFYGDHIFPNPVDIEFWTDRP